MKAYSEYVLITSVFPVSDDRPMRLGFRKVSGTGLAGCYRP